MQKICLTDQSPKHWAPIANVVEWLCQQIPEGAKVLEIGPGHIPFPKANVFIDIQDRPNVIICDMNEEQLPFEDKEFDFVYCRHVLEDLYRPFHACREMSRVAKAGYVETPSPMCEFSRGVDGSSPVYRGYHHHHYMVWPKDDVLQFLPKYPIIEYIASESEKGFIERLSTPLAWNSYFLWRDELKFRHLQNPKDFYITGDYPATIHRAIGEWEKSARAFFETIQGKWSIN